MALPVDFNAYDKWSWFWPLTQREDANSVLESQEPGVFLVRRSSTMKGDFVLCVKEENGRVAHYIINRLATPKSDLYKFYGRDYPDISSLLEHYKTHIVGTIGLLRPAEREKLLCKWDFSSGDDEDLSVQRGDVLELISEDVPEWWMAKDKDGEVGQIPSSFVEKVGASAVNPPREQVSELCESILEEDLFIPPSQVKLPAKAIVIRDRRPNMYDKVSLRLPVGHIVTVYDTNTSGQWEGECDGQRGVFPMTCVRFLTEDELSRITDL